MVVDAANDSGRFDEILILDDNWPDGIVLGVTVAGGSSRIPEFCDKETAFFVALGDNALRETWSGRILSFGGRITSIIHPGAMVSRHASISPGVVVLAGAVLNANARVEEGVIVNTSASVDHDCHLGSYCHVAPGCVLAGGVTIGSRSLLGVGTRIIPRCSVGSDSTIGAGATVCCSLPSRVLAVGTPARVKRHI